jgi:predicted O-linked N-acetylglucosamine transferase (SPINDLY family)
LGEHIGQFIGDDVFKVSVIALVVLTGATAAWIASRRQRYVKSIEFKRGIEALRLELGRSIDEARAATTRKAAAVGDKLLSVIKPIDTSVTELAARLARLEERADSVEAFLAGPQQNALQEATQIAARLGKLEQKLSAATDQVSLIEQAIDGASLRDRERNNAIEGRFRSTEKQLGDLFWRLELGEKARADLGGLISLFVKQLKNVNITSAKTAVRVAELESQRSKINEPKQRLSSTPDPESHHAAENFTTSHQADVGHTSPSPGERPAIETNVGLAGGEATSTEKLPNESVLAVSRISENSSAIGANGHA